MRLPLAAAFFCLPLLPAALAAEKEKAKGKPVEYEVHKGYFESNRSGLKGAASYLAFTNRKAFDAVFGVGFTMGKKPNVLPENAFESKMVAAVIKRGKSITEYNVEKVTADGGTLYVQYEATEKGGGGTATFASPLIVSVDRGKYTSVVFIENGKKVGTAKVEK
jgi:hypothetical protein